MTTQHRATPDPLAYTRRGAIDASGLPGKTLDHFIGTGQLKAIKSGRRLIILREDLQALLLSFRERGELPAAPLTDEDRERLAVLNRARRAAP